MSVADVFGYCTGGTGPWRRESRVDAQQEGTYNSDEFLSTDAREPGPCKLSECTFLEKYSKNKMTPRKLSIISLMIIKLTFHKRTISLEYCIILLESSAATLKKEKFILVKREE